MPGSTTSPAVSYTHLGILTARGGMTSHAAVVARGMGKCCVSGAGDLVIDYKNRTITVGTKTYKEVDWISLNGSTGVIYEGKVATKDAEVSGDFAKLMELADEFAHLKVRANADTPRDAKTAFRFGAQGIGLCRTEHMLDVYKRQVSMRTRIVFLPSAAHFSASSAKNTIWPVAAPGEAGSPLLMIMAFFSAALSNTGCSSSSSLAGSTRSTAVFASIMPSASISLSLIHI